MAHQPTPINTNTYQAYEKLKREHDATDRSDQVCIRLWMHLYAFACTWVLLFFGGSFSMYFVSVHPLQTTRSHR